MIIYNILYIKFKWRAQGTGRIVLVRLLSFSGWKDYCKRIISQSCTLGTKSTISK